MVGISARRAMVSGRMLEAVRPGMLYSTMGRSHGLGHGGEMAIVALLRRLVVVRADHEGAVGAGPACAALVRRIASRVLLEPVPGHDLDPAGARAPPRRR